MKPWICGATPLTLADCYEFSLVTLMGAEYSNADSAKGYEGTEGIRAFKDGNIISCDKGTCDEILVPFHAVKTFESHIITDVEGDAESPIPYSKCLTTDLHAPTCEDEE